jgi:hypothetical protein
VPPELPSSPQSTILKIFTPFGQLQRRFNIDETLLTVKNFVSSADTTQEDMDQFHFVTVRPRLVFKDLSVTLKEAGLVPNGILHLETVSEEDQ